MNSFVKAHKTVSVIAAIVLVTVIAAGAVLGNRIGIEKKNKP